ncbi:hypothetical protein NFI96_014971 [Prochilodus magdalenae]|nr:hypothetical protein NFI96_014971 [Prochilodus magdalenae]
MLLAGPLTKQLIQDLQTNPFAGQSLASGALDGDVFDCREPLPAKSRDYFQYLHSRGVTHFKVPLSWLNILPTGDSSQPNEDTVACYRNLVKELTESGIQPLLELHRAALPEGLRSRYGGWENPIIRQVFQDYAGFIFARFGDLVHSYITFSHLHELRDSSQFQHALQSHVEVYKLYHHSFKGGHVSLGMKDSDISTLSQTGYMHQYTLISIPFLFSSQEYMDFLSVHMEYDCTTETSLTKAVTEIQRAIGEQYILMYQVNIKNCADRNVQPLVSVIEALRKTDVHLMGCDITNLLGNLDQGDASVQTEDAKAHRKARSTSALSYQTVWDKFRTESPSDRDHFLVGSFPDGFQWAASSESFKVEGGWAKHGKGETIWDRFGHEGKVLDGQTADVACDSYHKVDYDVYLLRGMLSPHYQFSISWARIFPTGQKESLLEQGALYYDKLIDTLLESGIEPTVTLYHWDLPQALQDLGGWTNDSIVAAFKEYADFCFFRYGNRVKTWNTFGSPWVVSNFGYGTGEHAPSIKDPIVASYQVTHNIIKSHAEAWHVYNDKYRLQQGGKVGIALHSEWAQPLNPDSPQDIQAAERYLTFMLGWFAHPIFVDGDYPVVLKNQIEKKKNECGQELARLPVFTEVEKARIKGTADFFGLNHYTSRLITDSPGKCVSGPASVGDFQTHIDPTWPTTVSSHVQSVPWGLRRLLNYIAAEYTSLTKVPIYITGNGMPTDYYSDVLEDTERVDYFRTYINEAMKAIHNDNVAVQRFTVQSLLDGFEGFLGYSQRFGLHYVNFETPDKPRRPKASAYFYSQVIKRNGFQDTAPIPFKQVLGERKENVKLPSLPPSEVPSQSKVVWEKFSSQSKFERKLYHYGTFPSDFQWGVSSSAYQIEGGWDADGKGPSVWDTFTHVPGNIPTGDTGDVACDSYNRFEEDLYMLRALKVKTYRLSLSWPRIFPDGRRTSLNKNGVDYYNRIINGLLAYDITPMVTLYHWDLPQALQDINGWDNVNLIDLFNDYCDFCYATFGDRVKFWMTFNEPHIIAWVGYGLGQIPPSIKDPGNAPYRVAHNLLKAHAKAYHTYDEKYRTTQGGLVSISLNTDWFEPLDVNIPREVAAADRALQFQLGWFAHPIFKNGDYPDAMKFQVGNKSEIQGLAESRLPVFTEEEKAYIQGTADVFCVNAYTTKMARHVTPQLSPPSYEYDQDIKVENVPDYYDTAMPEMKAVAWGLRRLLNWIKEEYGNPEIYITENGVSTDVGITVDDTDRVFFLKTYVDEALKAQNLDGVQLKGYTAWSLLDSFEWLKWRIFLPKKRTSYLGDSLPEFTPEEITRIKGTHDFFGLNYYTSILAFNVHYPDDAQTYDADKGVGAVHDRTWLDSGSDWLKVYPYGFRKILNYIKEEYGNPPIYVTENGVSERGDIDLNDVHRIHYYENYINQAMKARLIDKVDIRGYTAWALMDNLEWAMGYSERFGLYYVNRSDPSLPRVPKKSVAYYATLVNCNGFPDPSQGPHECQNLGTTEPPLSHIPDRVNFLGLEVSSPDAEVALYVLFSLTIVGVIVAALITYQFIRVKKNSKRPVLEQIGLERKF